MACRACCGAAQRRMARAPRGDREAANSCGGRDLLCKICVEQLKGARRARAAAGGDGALSNIAKQSSCKWKRCGAHLDQAAAKREGRKASVTRGQQQQQIWLDPGRCADRSRYGLSARAEECVRSAKRRSGSEQDAVRKRRDAMWGAIARAQRAGVEAADWSALACSVGAAFACLPQLCALQVFTTDQARMHVFFFFFTGAAHVSRLGPLFLAICPSGLATCMLPHAPPLLHLVVISAVRQILIYWHRPSHWCRRSGSGVARASAQARGHHSASGCDIQSQRGCLLLPLLSVRTSRMSIAEHAIDRAGAKLPAPQHSLSPCTASLLAAHAQQAGVVSGVMRATPLPDALRTI